MTRHVVFPLLLLLLPPLLSPAASQQLHLPTALSHQFDPVFLQPLTPSAAVATTYNLSTELAIWRPLSILSALLSNATSLSTPVSDPSPLLLFAPTNTAFFNLFRILRPNIPKQPAKLLPDLLAIWANLSAQATDLPSLEDLLRYHVVLDDFTEQQIHDRGSLTTLLGVQLVTSRFPVLDDVDPSLVPSRLARQIQTTTDRVVIVDNILLPFNVMTALSDAGVTLPVRQLQQPYIARQATPTLFAPLNSLIAFVKNRNDLSILFQLLQQYPKQVLQPLQTLAKAGTKVHLFAPTNAALLNFAGVILPPSMRNIDPDALSDDTTVFLAEQLKSLWTLSAGLGVPSLVDVLFYHAVQTTKSYTQLRGQSAMQTLLPNTSITVTASGVMDADPSRENAQLVTSWANTAGYVSIIDDLLLHFDSTVIRGVLNTLLPTLAPNPTPQTTSMPEETLSPSDAPAASPLVSPVATATATAGGAMMESPLATATATAPSSPAQPGETVTPDASPEEESVCFPGDATVRTREGEVVRMDMLQPGVHVAVSKANQHSAVFLFTHRRKDVVHEFVRLSTKSGHVVELSKGHYVFANGRLTAAESVVRGDILETDAGLSNVVGIDRVSKKGLYAPHTMHGDLMVNGVRVSGYSTAVHPTLAHWILAPLRALVRLGVKEPLGGVLYDGAPALVGWVPSGRNVY